MTRFVRLTLVTDVTHHAEPDACDLLMEVDQLAKIIDFADKANYSRICLYLISCANYVPEPEDSQILNVVVKIYLKLKDLAAALRIALRLNDLPLIKQIFNDATEAYVLAHIVWVLFANLPLVRNASSWRSCWRATTCRSR